MSPFTESICCISFTSSVIPVAVSELLSEQRTVSRTCILKYFGVFQFGHSLFSADQAGGFTFHQDVWFLAQLLLKKVVFSGLRNATYTFSARSGLLYLSPWTVLFRPFEIAEEVCTSDVLPDSMLTGHFLYNRLHLDQLLKIMLWAGSLMGQTKHPT